MNHPRLRSRRLLLLVPPALLGAALLVRARLPRPQTEGDKWLWEQAEQAPSLTLAFGDAGKSVVQHAGLPYQTSVFHKDLGLLLEVSDRQGIREVLRALEGTPAFQPGRVPFRDGNALNAACVVQILSGKQGEILFVTQEPRGAYVYLVKAHRFAALTHRSAEQLSVVLNEVLTKGKEREEGYRLHDLTASQRRQLDARIRASHW